MQSLQTIKRRLRGVKSIGQITKAMELVAATKMRRSQEVALASRPYVYTALELLANMSEVSTTYMPTMLQKRPVKNTVIVVIASDKGLTGSFNSAVFRAFEKFFVTLPPEASRSYIAVGQKAISYISKRVKTPAHSFTRFADITTLEETIPLADTLINGYLEERWDRALVLYTNFKSAMQQEVVWREILPVDFESLKNVAEEIVPKTGRYAEAMRESGVNLFQKGSKGAGGRDYIIEPSPEAVLDQLLPFLLRMQVYHIVLEANASEHAARRMAMKNASDNASDIADTLGLEYNKSRQAGITRELIEITGGVESLTKN